VFVTSATGLGTLPASVHREEEVVVVEAAVVLVVVDEDEEVAEASVAEEEEDEGAEVVADGTAAAEEVEVEWIELLATTVTKLGILLATARSLRRRATCAARPDIYLVNANAMSAE